MHEQSETVQDENGNWVNVFGRGTGNAGSPLPGMPRYSTSSEAGLSAAKRSRSFHGSEAPLDVQRYWERSYTPPVKEKQMPGLSQYQFAGMSPNPRDAQNPRNPALANHTMSAQDNAGLDEMLKNLDSGQAAPSNLSQARQTMGPGTGQQGNPWMQWLQQFVQQFGQGGAPGAPPQR